MVEDIKLIIVEMDIYNFAQKLIHTVKRHITSYHLQRMVQNDTTWKEMSFCERSESIY